jgi:hypothetical protein
MREITTVQVAQAMGRITSKALSSFSHPIRLILTATGMGLDASDNFLRDLQKSKREDSSVWEATLELVLDEEKSVLLAPGVERFQGLQYDS